MAYQLIKVAKGYCGQASVSIFESLVNPLAVLSSLCVRMLRMKAAVNLLWVLLSFLGAVALAFVAGIVNPHEKVNEL